MLPDGDGVDGVGPGSVFAIAEWGSVSLSPS